MNRRRFVVETSAFLLSSAFLRRSGIADTRSGFASSYSEEMPDMLIGHLANGLNELASAWDRKRALLSTAPDVEARNAFVREKVVQMLGKFPPRNPLEPVTVKVMQKDGYRIENIMFQSRPDFWVTGNLYVPTAGKGPFPAIVSPCGHYPLARMLPQYQSVYLSLVKNGFVVLGYDPIGQGERRRYWNPQTNVTEVGGATYEHSMAGQVLLLLGENLTEYLVWDGMRAIDYLLTRPEVDSQRIGCAGHSGGGTITKFISVVDTRVQCAAIMEGGTANMWPARSVGLADVEQNLFPAALYGIDNVDLHVAVAPRPLLAGIEYYGEAFDTAARAIQARYRQLGVEEKFATVAADDPHAWTPKLRLATTDWFCRWFYGRPGPQSEPEFETNPPEGLYCTPDGSIRYAHKGLTIFSLIAQKQADLPPRVAVPATGAEREEWQQQVRDRIRSLLRYRKSDQPLNVRPVVTTPREGYRIDKLQFLSEPGIYIPVWVFIPEKKKGILPTILYFNDEGMEADAMEFEGPEASGLKHGVLDSLVHAGYLVIAVDVRGIGETRPTHSSPSPASEFGQLFNTETSIAYAAWFMNQSLLGMRVQDVLRSVDYVSGRDDVDQEHLHLIGKGTGGLWCLYAAALDARIRSLICVQSLLSYHSLTGVDRYRYGADVFVPDILMHLDLPQVAAAIVDRPVALVQPLDAMKRAVGAAAAEEAYAWTTATYEGAAKRDLFRIETEGAELDTAGHYLSLLQRKTQ
jgi:cephalosporin-C deacetylase-like acetyl esterase